ncbi:MAG TPA: MCE family protein [Pseudonocardia sp.]|jgi:virulence factor Mce-like protein
MRDFVDPSGRGDRPSVLAVRGVVAVLVISVVVALLLVQYRGGFRDVVRVTAVLDDIGDGVNAGADVKLRGVLVGQVSALELQPGAGPHGLPTHAVTLEMRPKQVGPIPASVTARVVPTNVFGAPSIELLAPEGSASAPRLRPDQVIHQDRSRGTLQLQTVLNQTRALLRVVQPAKLSVVLGNISQALDGRGATLASLLDQGDAYLTALNGHAGEFTATLTALGAGLEGLKRNAPALLDTVDNVVVTSQTIVAKRERLAAALTGADHTVQDLLPYWRRYDTRFVNDMHDGAGLVATIAQSPMPLAESLSGLGAGAAMLANSLGPGHPLELGFNLLPFAPYTAKDCPRYASPKLPGGDHPAMVAPNCGKPVPSEVGLPTIPNLPGLRAVGHLPGHVGKALTPPAADGTGTAPNGPAGQRPRPADPAPPNSGLRGMVDNFFSGW